MGPAQSSTAAVAVENDRLPARRNQPVTELQDTRFVQVHLNDSQSLSRLLTQSGLFPTVLPLPPSVSARPTVSAVSVAQSSQDIGSYQAFKNKWMI